MATVITQATLATYAYNLSLTSGNTSKIEFPLLTKKIALTNEGAVALRIYFNAADAAADRNYVEIGDSTTADNYYEQPNVVQNLYLIPQGGNTECTVVVGYQGFTAF